MSAGSLARVGELLGEGARLLGEGRMEHVGEIAEDQWRLRELGLERPDVGEGGRLGDLPFRPVGDGIEAHATQLPQGDLGPGRMPLLGAEGADEVRSEVVDVGHLAPATPGVPELPVRVGQVCDRLLEAADRRGRLVDKYTVEARRPEGVAVRIDEPGPFPIVRHAEPAGTVELLARRPAPAAPVIGPALLRRLGALRQEFSP